VTPVYYRAGNQVRVGNNDGNIIGCRNRGAAQIDLCYASNCATHLDSIPQGDRRFGQNDQTADEVTYDILQAESNADSQCPDQKRQRIEIDFNRLQREIGSQGQNCVAGDPGDGELDGRQQPGPAQHPRQKDASKNHLRNPHRRQQHYQFDQVAEGEWFDEREIQDFSPKGLS